MNTLSEHLIAEIGSHLLLEDRVNCLNTCKLFKSIMYNFTYHSINNITDLNEKVKIIKKRKPRLENLLIKITDIDQLKHLGEKLELNNLKEIELMLRLEEWEDLVQHIEKLPIRSFREITLIQEFNKNAAAFLYATKEIASKGGCITQLVINHHSLSLLDNITVCCNLKNLSIKCEYVMREYNMNHHINLENVPESCFVELIISNRKVTIKDSYKVTEFQVNYGDIHASVFETFTKQKKPLSMRQLRFDADLSRPQLENPMFNLAKIAPTECKFKIRLYEYLVTNAGTIQYVKNFLSIIKHREVSLLYTSQSTLALTELIRRLVSLDIKTEPARFEQASLNYYPSEEVLHNANTADMQDIVQLMKQEEQIAWWWINQHMRINT